MKYVCAIVLMAVFLTGCSSPASEIQRGMALRSQILQASSCSFETEITADYGDKLYTFSVSCTGDQKGDISFCVTEPETIAGITGEVSEESGSLTFEETVLFFDKMADDQISPVTAPWIFLKTLRSGNLTSVCLEEELLRMSIDDSYEDDALHLDIWLDTNNIPIRAEILYDGSRILSLNVKNFVIL